jgi:hypothetical protein
MHRDTDHGVMHNIALSLIRQGGRGSRCHDSRSDDHCGGESPEEMHRYPEHVRPESVVILATPQWFL